MLKRITFILLTFLLFSTLSCSKDKKERSSNKQLESHVVETSKFYGRGASLGDLNGDGIEEIIISDNSKFSSTPIILKWHKKTYIRTPVNGLNTEDFSFGSSNYLIDFDLDGSLDLLSLAGGFRGKGSISIYLNTSTINSMTFKKSKDNYGLPLEKDYWFSASIAYLNLDKYPDIILTRKNGTTLTYVSGANGYYKKLNQDLPNSNISHVFDFNKNGKIDLVLGNSEHLSFFEWDKSTWKKATRLESFDYFKNPNIFTSTIADLNNDGWVDLYLSRWNQQDTILFNLKGSFLNIDKKIDFIQKVLPIRSETTMGIGAFDLNGDSLPELVIGTGYSKASYKDIVWCPSHQKTPFPNLKYTRCDLLPSTLTRVHSVLRASPNHDNHFLIMTTGGSFDHDTKEKTDSRNKPLFYRLSQLPKHFGWVTLKRNEGVNLDFGASIISREKAYPVVSSIGNRGAPSRKILIPLGNSKELQIEIRWSNGKISRHLLKHHQHLVLNRP